MQQTLLAKEAKWLRDVADPLLEIELTLSLDIAAVIDELKDCDRQICEMLVAGYKEAEIARELKISKV